MRPPFPPMPLPMNKGPAPDTAGSLDHASRGSSVSLPPTVFGWQETAANFGAPVPRPAGASIWGGFSASGHQSTARSTLSTHSIQVARLAVTSLWRSRTAHSPLRFPCHSRAFRWGGQFVLLDANGDGRMELIYAVNNSETLGLTLFTAECRDGSWTLVRDHKTEQGPAAWGSAPLSGVDADGTAWWISSWV